MVINIFHVTMAILKADEKDICQDYVAATACENCRVRFLELNVSMIRLVLMMQQ
jgi:hypothetical protein